MFKLRGLWCARRVGLHAEAHGAVRPYRTKLTTSCALLCFFRVVSIHAGESVHLQEGKTHIIDPRCLPASYINGMFNMPKNKEVHTSCSQEGSQSSTVWSKDARRT
ncbi:hypothetical protein DAEQUDRAFT_313507 [Daedalea quercina L-15889]|uniref:Uncharacterized protein n=1 Tax=Daedalea quercina L-15889 TaxID=1314783 RepID=A0A165PUW6_9APHY|nr:hypothetical protein DAEQUDRAFT_313507 [Daedalea quercina L-15889]